MDFFELAITFILGCIIGSFLNVVIYRYNSGASPLKGRSLCFACGKTLSWYELIPVLSFLVQGARCRGCKVKLSGQYPAVEVFTGVMFAAVYALGLASLETAYLFVIFSILIVIGVYDVRHQIIPDGLAAAFAILSLIWYFVAVPEYHAFSFPYAWTLLAGPILFAPFFFLWAVSRGRWIGFGDAKLAVGIGWFLGMTLGASAIMLAFWVGAVWALLLMGAQRFMQKLGLHAPGHLLSMQSEVPFGPFLILGVFVVYFTKVNFFDGSIDILKLLGL